MIKWYKGKKRWISMILCLIICMQTTIKIQAAAPGYFDNPQTIYNEFKGKIVDISYEKQYAFLKNKEMLEKHTMQYGEIKRNQQRSIHI